MATRRTSPAISNDRDHAERPGLHQSLQQRLTSRARERWPQLIDLTVRHRAGFAYLTGHLSNGEQLPLCRLRYGGSASSWGFAIHLASHDDY